MSAAELSLRVPLARLSNRPQDYLLEPDERTREALARRFDLLSVDALKAELAVARSADGATLSGRLTADVVQRCVVSGEPVPAHVDEALELRFEPPGEDAEIELEEEALDVLPVEEEMIDLGEAVAQSLAVALDPYPRASPELLSRARALLLSEEQAAALAAADKAAASPFSRLRKQ